MGVQSVVISLGWGAPFGLAVLFQPQPHKWACSVTGTRPRFHHGCVAQTCVIVHVGRLRMEGVEKPAPDHTGRWDMVALRLESCQHDSRSLSAPGKLTHPAIPSGPQMLAPKSLARWVSCPQHPQGG